MRRRRIELVALLLATVLCPSATAAEIESQVEFVTPAAGHVEQMTTSSEDAWMILIYGKTPAKSMLRLTAHPDSTVIEEQYSAWSAQYESTPIHPMSGNYREDRIRQSSTTFGGDSLETEIMAGASIVLHAPAIDWRSMRGEVTIHQLEPSDCASRIVRQVSGPTAQLPRNVCVSETHLALALKNGATQKVMESIISFDNISFHNTTFHCSTTADCPRDAMVTRNDVSAAANTKISILETQTTDLSGQMQAHNLPIPDAVFLVARQARLHVDAGFLRLPLAEGLACSTDSCGTLEGNITSFSGSFDATMTARGNRIASATVVGTGIVTVDAVEFGDNGVAIAASLSLLALILLGIKALGALLLGATSPQAIEAHPRRQLLLKAIKQNPGPTFRELIKETGIPTGTARHHLAVLKKADLIITKRHKSTLRFFENHGRFERSWNSVVLLREPAMAQLHGWLMKHQGSFQKDIVGHAEEAWSWGRSTTQHRLRRLEDEGLIQVKEQGRLKVYTAVEVAPTPEDVVKPVPAPRWAHSP